MTDLTPLSPAAQAVLSAYVSSPIRNGDKPAVAAVLRAAAKNLSHEVDAPKVDGSKYAGIWHAFDYLNAIADELERTR